MGRLKVILIPPTVPLAMGGIIFTAAGRMNLPFVWAVVGLIALFYLLLVLFADEGMMRERLKPGPGNRDRVTQAASGAMLLVHWVLTGLDVGRFHWSAVPRALQMAGLIVFAAGLAITFCAVMSNPFYSSVVRVQADRGQQVVARGPYGIVRHPGYTGTLVAMIGGGLALGSWVGLIPMVVFFVLFIRRTLVEDRMLRQELEGYAEYARRVRWRLVVGVF
jgi:protein-S-isoprenylcysteine O-methyltransferase Ste14